MRYFLCLRLIWRQSNIFLTKKFLKNESQFKGIFEYMSSSLKTWQINFLSVFIAFFVTYFVRKELRLIKYYRNVRLNYIIIMLGCPSWCSTSSQSRRDNNCCSKDAERRTYWSRYDRPCLWDGHDEDDWTTY